MIDPKILPIAAHYSIDPKLIQAIITQESQGNTNAIRYESGYRFLYKPEMFVGPLNSMNTEINLQRCSWGLGQVMGALAREQGHLGLMGELLVPELGITHLSIRVHHLLELSENTDDIFAMYNGGPGAIHKSNGKYINQGYVTSANAHLQNLK